MRLECFEFVFSCDGFIKFFRVSNLELIDNLQLYKAVIFKTQIEIYNEHNIQPVT